MLIELTSAAQTHDGTQDAVTYYVAKEHIVSLYRSLDGSKTVVYMSDGRVYDVVETPDAINTVYKRKK